MMEQTPWIWMNGELVEWADAKVHVGTHGLHYGSGVFEGVRAYETPRGTAVFLVGPPGPITLELQQAYLDTVRGRSERWPRWLEHVPAAATAGA